MNRNDMDTLKETLDTESTFLDSLNSQMTDPPNVSGFRVRTFQIDKDDELVKQLSIRLILGIRADFNFFYEYPLYSFVVPVQYIRAFDNAVSQIRNTL